MTGARQPTACASLPVSLTSDASNLSVGARKRGIHLCLGLGCPEAGSGAHVYLRENPWMNGSEGSS